MSPWLFNVYMDRVMKEVKMGTGRRGVRFPGGWERVEIDSMASCMQMNCFCVVSWSRT